MEAERLLVVQPVAQISTVISSVTEQLPGYPGAADQALGGRAIVRLATGQQEGKKTAFSICDCVDFRIASAAADVQSPGSAPPFAPEAERCALTCVESII